MPSFAELLAQAEAEGVLTGRSETLAAGTYQMYVESAKSKKTKAGDPSISIRWKTSAGQSTYQNLNFIPDNKVGNAITVSNLVDLGVSRDYLARVDVSQGLEPLVPELIRVTQGRWFEVDVTVKKSGGYTNNNFFIKSSPTDADVYVAPAVQVYAPQPAPVAIPVAQPIPQPAPVAVPQTFYAQGVPPMQGGQTAPVPVAIPQPAPVDPTTGLPPRPGAGI